ncbi:hypothetical protein FHX34_1011427 [Actinoplanes teichomyceticus]|uniref:Uncharacterized protein n=1 Tax=Actinoplanes teichomyceticus TaxID=1867 RepID=A0A561WRG0_ACTTI|nr:hypothetical protein FHX34_1011427 [Actinoplanes teichomyceticus]
MGWWVGRGGVGGGSVVVRGGSRWSCVLTGSWSCTPMHRRCAERFPFRQGGASTCNRAPRRAGRVPSRCGPRRFLAHGTLLAMQEPSRPWSIAGVPALPGLAVGQAGVVFGRCESHRSAIPLRQRPTIPAGPLAGPQGSRRSSPDPTIRAVPRPGRPTTRPSRDRAVPRQDVPRSARPRSRASRDRALSRSGRLAAQRSSRLPLAGLQPSRDSAFLIPRFPVPRSGRLQIERSQRSRLDFVGATTASLRRRDAARQPSRFALRAAARPPAAHCRKRAGRALPQARPPHAPSARPLRAAVIPPAARPPAARRRGLTRRRAARRPDVLRSRTVTVTLSWAAGQAACARRLRRCAVVLALRSCGGRPTSRAVEGMPCSVAVRGHRHLSVRSDRGVPSVIWCRSGQPIRRGGLPPRRVISCGRSAHQPRRSAGPPSTGPSRRNPATSPDRQVAIRLPRRTARSQSSHPAGPPRRSPSAPPNRHVAWRHAPGPPRVVTATRLWCRASVSATGSAPCAGGNAVHGKIHSPVRPETAIPRRTSIFAPIQLPAEPLPAAPLARLEPLPRHPTGAHLDGYFTIPSVQHPAHRAMLHGVAALPSRLGRRPRYRSTGDCCSGCRCSCAVPRSLSHRCRIGPPTTTLRAPAARWILYRPITAPAI